MDQQNVNFKFQLTFGSLVKFSTIIGLCFGVGSIPFIFFTNIGNLSEHGAGLIVSIPSILIATPIVGIINGALVGILGYPLYYWLSKKVGVSYMGMVYVNEQSTSNQAN